jgi:excisionase family DNA binding protein
VAKDLTPAEAAEELRIGRTKLYELICHNELDSYRVGNRLRRITRESMDAFKERNRIAGREG